MFVRLCCCVYNIAELGTFLVKQTTEIINMKNIFTTAVLITLLSSFTIKVGIEDIINTMKTGNAAQMAKFFDNNVEISMPDKSNSYSKSQAEMVLKDFFASNPVKSFEVIHKGENAGSQYCIGTLQTKNGAYRTTIFMKQKGELQVLQELRFENR
jgi:hypothetical protein